MFLEGPGLSRDRVVPWEGSPESRARRGVQAYLLVVARRCEISGSAVSACRSFEVEVSNWSSLCSAGWGI